MKYLLNAAREYGLNNIADQALENESVHGIIVDLHPLWLRLYKHHLMFPNLRINMHQLVDYYFRGLGNFESYLFLGDSNPYFSAMVPMEINWYPEYWNDYFGDKNNLLVRILLRPGSRSIELFNTESRMTIVQEHSVVPRLSASAKDMIRPLEGGVSVGHLADPPGTLGGILYDSAGKKYALTCGHVIDAQYYSVDQPSSIDSSTFGAVGRCVYCRLATPNHGNQCNSRNTAYLNDMDLALIELDSTITSSSSILNIGNIRNFTPAIKLHPNMPVEFNGRTTGYQALVTGGIGFVQEIEDTKGNKACFKELIELKQPVMSSLVFKRPVEGGDSGAWVIVNGDTGPEWCGMIVGENRQAGYAIHSEDILTHLNGQGYRLSL